ncbi:MAG TPA: dihydrodipicolinate synthase family protein [Vicinamibacterales bacterium]|nr:dihydrodipicolinate synthase family protein [Vicinamibacterales bacterium]
MKLSGVFAPIPTPIDEQDQVDTRRLRAALEQWVKQPLAGFVVLGSNGEAALLDELESDRVIAAAREAIPRGTTMVVGTGRESTQGAIKASKRAAELGADYVLVRTPGFFKSQMTTDVFVRHYTAVADASPVPVLLYNFTAVTGVNLLPPAVARLATHANIAGMKESGGDIAQIAEVVATTPADFQMIAGSLATFYAALCVGCVGGILAPACVVPDACDRLYALTRDGRHEEAQRLQKDLLPIAKLLGGGGYGVAGLKAALAVIGYDVGIPRPPLVPAPEAAFAAVRQTLAQLSSLNSNGQLSRLNTL